MAKPVGFPNRAVNSFKTLSPEIRKKIAKSTTRAPNQPTAPTISDRAVLSDSALQAVRKSPRPGSDMDQMVQDLERTGALPKQVEASPQRPAPRKGSDMAQMLTDIDAANTSFKHANAQVGANGTLVLLEESSPAVALTKSNNKNTAPSQGKTDDALSGTGVAIEGVEQVGNNLSSVAEVAGEVMDQGSQVVSQSAKALGATTMDTALQVASLASGALVVPLIYRGTKELKNGIKEGDLDKKLEGGNSIAIGARSGATAVTLAGESSKLASGLGEVASFAAPALGIATAAVDGVLGVREIRKGKKLDGLLRIGFALSVGAAAAGAGPVATAATAGFLVARVGRKIADVRRERKAPDSGKTDTTTG